MKQHRPVTVALALTCAVALGSRDAEAQTGLSTVAIVGAEDGPGPDVFGLILAIASRPNGDFFVLDAQSLKLSWFTQNGEFVAATGRSGSGPGEFLEPRSVIVRSDDVVVLDAANARLEFFRAEQAGRLTHVASKPYHLGGRSFCSIRDRLFVNVSRDGRLVHEIGDGATPLRSFAPVPTVRGLESLGPFRPMAEGMLTSGIALCVERPDLIIVAATAQPFVSAYRPDGTHVWTSTLAGYNQIEYELLATGALRTRIRSGEGAHIAQHMVRWSEGAIMVQYEMRKRDGRANGSDPAVESRIFDISNGAEIERRRDLPFIAAAAGPLFYGVAHSPFPHVRVLTR